MGVPKCVACGYKKKQGDSRAFFRAPDAIKAEWEKILDCKILKDSRVCEKHFDESSYTKKLVSEHNGLILLNVSK